MKKIFLFWIFFALFLSSCSGRETQEFSNFFESDTHETILKAPGLTTVTPAKTSTPSPTPKPTETIHPSATPFGGKPLRVAYLGFDCKDVDSNRCIIIADFFTSEVRFKYPLNDLTTKAHMSWSPNGNYLMFTDRWESYVNVMLLDMETQKSVVIDTYLLRMPTQLVSDTGSVKKYSTFVVDNNVSFSRWSPDGKYVAYKTAFSGEDNSIYVYSVEDQENVKLADYLLSFYWLDDSENLLEIKTGNLYNVKTKEITKIPYAYFMNATSIFGDSIVLTHGDAPYYPDTISLLSKNNDLQQLMKDGTKILYDNELVIAKAFQENNYKDFEKKYSLSINNYFIQGNEIIITGYLRRGKPYFSEPFIKFGNMNDLPLIISKDDLFEGRIFLISPDQQFFLGGDTIWDKNLLTEKYTRISLINCYDFDTRELIHSYDMHSLADDPHDVMYFNNVNLAFYWED